MSTLSWKWRGIALLVLVGTLGPAQAGLITYTETLSLTPTNWDLSVTVPKFDPTWGNLTSVAFQLEGHLESDILFENKSPKSSNVTSAVEAEITLWRPDQTSLVVTLPIWSHTETVAGYDGKTDFGGASGRTYNDVTGDDTDSATSSLAADLALFSGSGNVTLPVSARGKSNFSGSGNLAAGAMTSASGKVTVTYNFAHTPEASPLVLFSLGGGVLVLVLGRHRLRRKSIKGV